MITAIVGVVLLCLLCAAGVRLVQRYIGPEVAVRAYFDALADRDANKARELLASGSAIGQPGPIAGVDKRADLSLLTNEILRSRGYTPPRNVSIERTNWTGVSATVEASYDLGGERIYITLPLLDERGRRELPAWRITDGLLELWLPPAATGRVVVVAGTSLRMTSARGSLVAFPGAYRVTLPEHPLYQTPPVIAFAGATSPSPSSIEVRESVRQDIEQQVRAHVDGCARRNELAPPGCPFYASNNSMAPATAVDWTITQYPQLIIEVVEGGTVTVRSAADGTATATATIAPALGGGHWQQNFPFAIRGTVHVVDGKAVLSITR